ncbi:MAG: hypothetical protein NUV54_03370 [Candidatus Taylorbacteria bacterium]|nr:hypothetical protein [Candidatus Taylorbacteria bacterium]
MEKTPEGNSELREELVYEKDHSGVEGTPAPNWAEGRAPNEVAGGKSRNEHKQEGVSTVGNLAELNSKKDEGDITKLREELLRGQGGK